MKTTRPAFRVAWAGLGLSLVFGMGQALAQDGGARIGSVFIKSQEALPSVPVVGETSRVEWATAKIAIDGDLPDWASIPMTKKLDGPAYASWLQGAYGGATDLSASLRTCRDDDFLYFAVEIHDDAAPAPNRVEIAMTKWDMPLISGWQDVGRRYGADDLHAMFDIRPDGTTAMHWGHIQDRRDRAAINPACGDRASRRLYVGKQLDGEFIPRGPADAAALGVVSAARHREGAGGGTATAFELALPWKLMLPYSPVSHQPVKFNIAVHDSDGGGRALAHGALAWMPGLFGTYSGVHFATLEFVRPAGRTGVDAFAQVSKHRFIDEGVEARFSFFNPGAQPVNGTLELGLDGGVEALASTTVALPPGLGEVKMAVHSEKMAGRGRRLVGRLRLADGAEIKIPIEAPSNDGTLTAYRLAELEAAIAQLESDANTLSNLLRQVEAKGLDTAYPQAYWALQRLFIARCKGDLRGDPQRMLDNTAHLRESFHGHKAYLEEILRNPAAQKRVPPRFDPEKLVIRDGVYTVDGKPVFLWGPCTFWYLRQDQRYVWELGFNSVGPEAPYHDEKSRPEVVRHLEAYRANGVMVNAAIGSSYFEEMIQEHPEIANFDANNFMPVIIQHPLVREEIERRMAQSIDFLREFPGIRSYWLWNEPEYVNTSEMTRRDFIEQHLKPQYGSIEALNARWKSNWKHFDEVALPVYDPANHAPWYDFQRFRDDRLEDFFAFLNRTSKRLDPSRPTHVKFMCLSCELFDSERMQSIYDIAGHDGNMSDRDVMILDLWKSLDPDRPLVNTEIHSWYRDFTLVSLLPWRLALHGLADGNWWCWHSSANFANTLASAPAMHALSVAGLDVQRLYDPYLVALNRKPARVATLFPDVIAARSAEPMNRLRHEIAPAQYTLGLRPFYVTEKTILADALEGRELLVACEASFVRDSTYRAVLDYVKRGGFAIVEAGGFAQNEYGDLRDASELVPPPAQGEAFGRHARLHRLGSGGVFCMGEIAAQDPDDRQAVVREVIGMAMETLAITDSVSLVAVDDSPAALRAMEWRVAEVGEGYVLCVLPYEGQAVKAGAFRLQTTRPVRRVTDLISGQTLGPGEFEIRQGPNLFLIELAR